jgi:epsilon-lactone hydrolase
VPSLSARIAGAVLRATGIVSKRYNGGPGMQKVIDLARAAPLPLPTDKMRRTCDVREEMVAGRSVWTIAPKGRAPAAHLLFFHGGGYVFSAVPPHWQFYARLAERHGIAVTAPMYPLAPEHGATEATQWSMAAYRHFLKTQDGPFVMGGDSAGGGMTAATVMAARDAGLQLPYGLLLICPWLDISGTHPDQPAIELRDSILRLRGIRDAGRLYARDLPIDDPRVSPIHGDWAGLPPILMFGGGDDILVTDARALKAKLPTADYREGAGLMHDWPLFFFPESRAAQAAIGQFVAERCAAA